MKKTKKNTTSGSVKTFNEKKLLLAFEYGVILSQTAKAQKIELTPEIVIRMEDILLDVCKKNTAERVALDMQVNILAALEVKEKN